MATTDEQKKLLRIAVLLTEVHLLRRQVDEKLAEVSALTAGQPTDAELVAQCADHFNLLWSARYTPGRAKGYQWRGSVDFPQLRRLVKALGVAEVQARMVAYLRSDEAFFVKGNVRHAFGVFVASINQLVAAQPPAVVEWRCPDDPPCAVGTTQHRCQQRALLNDGRRQQGLPLLGVARHA